jgi:hypothetical protein
MSRKSANQSSTEKLNKKHRFFLNPYEDCAFTKCPKCETKTKIRKFPLVIHVEPQQLFLLNKQCKYCANCDLIIAKKQELESLMAAGLSQTNPQVIGNEYLVIGTVERKDWKAGSGSSLSAHEIIERISVFKDQWNFEVIPPGWYPSQSK